MVGFTENQLLVSRVEDHASQKEFRRFMLDGLFNIVYSGKNRVGSGENGFLGTYCFQVERVLKNCSHSMNVSFL